MKQQSPYILNVFYVHLIIPYYYKIKLTLKSLYIMKIKGPFVKLVMFDGTPAQL
jgi:hypothetical protein